MSNKVGRELDCLIEEKIFKQKTIHTTWNKGKGNSYTIGEPNYYYTADEPGGILANSIPHYSTDISAAWSIVEKLIENGDAFTLLFDHGWFANKEGFREVSEITAPHAICLAALVANGIEIDE